LSVTNTLGAKPCFLSSLRMSFKAASLSRRRCTSRSRTSPSSSTARHSQNCLPAISTAISLRCHRAVARWRLRQSSRANKGPNFKTPDVLGHDRTLYADRKTLVAGAGHSAANALLDLAVLAERAPRTEAIWATRGTDLTRVFLAVGSRINYPLAASLELISRNSSRADALPLPPALPSQRCAKPTACL
jgi:hypothetical protein